MRFTKLINLDCFLSGYITAEAFTRTARCGTYAKRRRINAGGCSHCHLLPCSRQSSLIDILVRCLRGTLVCILTGNVHIGSGLLDGEMQKFSNSACHLLAWISSLAIIISVCGGFPEKNPSKYIFGCRIQEVRAFSLAWLQTH